MFAAELVGNDRLRPGYLALSAGLPNSRLWQCKTPLIVLWNHLHIASLKLTGEVTAFTSLNSADHTSKLGMNEDATKKEGEYFAMAAISSLPEWVISDELKELREICATGPCRLPHEKLKAVQSEEQHNVTAGVARSPEVVVHEVPPPREIDTWGDTICVELLRESPLVVCKVEMSTARGRQSTVMLHCFASEEPTQWGVVVLAAPKELWMEKGDSNVAVCKRHGETRPESTKQISGSYLVINECLHPSSRMAFFLWNRITSECFNPSLQHFAQEVLGCMDLDVWQNGVMKQGLHDLAEKFSVRAGQRGFFARPSRKLETLTLAERAQQGHLPFELGKNKEGKRQKKKHKLPDGVLDQNVHSVTQELRWKPVVFAFMLFPLFWAFRLDFWLFGL